MREGFQVNNNQLILLYELVDGDDKEIKRLKSTKCGVVKKRHHKDGDIVDVEWVFAAICDPAKKNRSKHIHNSCIADVLDVKIIFSFDFRHSTSFLFVWIF